MFRSNAPFLSPETLYLSLQRGEETPFFYRVSLRRFTTLASWVASVVAVLFLLSLLFFRELEKNRQLEERLLTLETDNQLMQLTRTATYLPPPPTEGKAPVEPKAALRQEPIPVTPGGTTSNWAKVGYYGIQCNPNACEASVNLLPTGNGMAEGSILFVLEAEVPRIGGQSVNSQKRFLLFPGRETLEELNPNQLATLSKKSFRFSRGLHTVANFQTGKLLRPLAINIYLFDKNGIMSRHERKPVEGVETDAH